MRAPVGRAEAHVVQEDGRYGTLLFPVQLGAGEVLKGPIRVLHLRSEASSGRRFRRAAFRSNCPVGPVM